MVPVALVPVKPRWTSGEGCGGALVPETNYLVEELAWVTPLPVPTGEPLSFPTAGDKEQQS